MLPTIRIYPQSGSDENNQNVNTELLSGYPCFVFSIGMIGVIVAMIGDVASHLGCFVELKDTVNAITLIAIGTALPDTFASKQAAIQVRP